MERCPRSVKSSHSSFNPPNKKQLDGDICFGPLATNNKMETTEGALQCNMGHLWVMNSSLNLKMSLCQLGNLRNHKEGLWKECIVWMYFWTGKKWSEGDRKLCRFPVSFLGGDFFPAFLLLPVYKYFSKSPGSSSRKIKKNIYIYILEREVVCT